MRKTVTIPVLLLVAFLLAAPAPAADHPAWRKPNSALSLTVPVAKLIFDFPVMKKGQDVGSQLDALGVDRGSLDAVVLTHTHIDHMGGIATLPTRVPVFHGQGEMAEFAKLNAGGLQVKYVKWRVVHTTARAWPGTSREEFFARSEQYSFSSRPP